MSRSELSSGLGLQVSTLSSTLPVYLTSRPTSSRLLNQNTKPKPFEETVVLRISLIALLVSKISAIFLKYMKRNQNSICLATTACILLILHEQKWGDINDRTHVTRTCQMLFLDASLDLKLSYQLHVILFQLAYLRMILGYFY